MGERILLALIPIFPLVGSLLAFCIGRTNKDSAGWIATGCSAASFAATLMLFSRLLPGQNFESVLFSWISISSLSVDFALRFDQLSAVMCLVVTGVGSLIHLYSVSYMGEDDSRHRFFSYLNLFLFSMLVLVLGANLLVLFVGWEGVGLCSYLLIGFWFKKMDYAGAGMKAFVVNRIGDAGFLIGMFILVQELGTLDFVSLKGAISSGALSVSVITFVALAFFVGATGKSAQIPLFVWLPDAMAGPTPVSALIHAATMVTAGVYLLARMSFLYTLSPFALAIVTAVATLTAFVAATIAIVQNDIKKVLAYSTVSQLGFMFVAAGVGAFWVAIFHVVTHAFFKACLFLGAGSVIHGCHHEQDMRHMGGLRKYMPITFVTYLIATLAIAGIYPFAGYQSKHAILEAVGHGGVPLANEIGFLLKFTGFLTAFYMTRSLAMTFLGSYRGHAHPHESPAPMTIPLVVLAFLSLVGGVYLAGVLPFYLDGVVVIKEAAHHGETFVEGILHSWVGLLGVGLGILFYGLPAARAIPGTIFSLVKPLGIALREKYYFDEVYDATIIKPLGVFSKILFRGVDQGIIDGAVNGTGAVVEVSGDVLRVTQSGQIRQYAFFMFSAAVLIVGLYLVS